LFCAVGMTSRQGIYDVVDQGEEFDGSLIDVRALKAEHVDCIGRAASGFVNGGVHLHVAVAVHDHVDDHDYDYVDVTARSAEP
jgi:hypothetical protein